MRYLQYYKVFERVITNLKLYHGSPYLFESFKPKTTFFTDDRKFATDYSEDKSIASGLDSQTKIYECKLNARIFDANIPEHLSLLADKLPDKITCYMTNFAFPHDYDKETLLELLKGDDIVEPFESMANAQIGDKIPDPTYKPDTLLVTNRDNDNVYAIHLRNFEYNVSGAASFSHSSFGQKYRNLFTSFREYVDVIMKRQKGYFDHEQKTTFFMAKDYHKIYKFDITDTEYQHGIELYNQCYSDMLKDYAKEYQKAYTIKPKKIKISDTWRFYENDTVTNEIKSLGFCGYIALEQNRNTYAIFNPHKSINIEFIYIGDMKFKDLLDIKGYYEIINELNNDIKRVNSFDVYKLYKDGLSIEQMKEKLK